MRKLQTLMYHIVSVMRYRTKLAEHDSGDINTLRWHIRRLKRYKVLGHMRSRYKFAHCSKVRMPLGPSQGPTGRVGSFNGPVRAWNMLQELQSCLCSDKAKTQLTMQARLLHAV